MVDVVGLALGAMPLRLVALREVLGNTATEFLRNTRAYGPYRAFLLQTVIHQARYVIQRVNRHIVDAPTDQNAQASSLKQSYVASFNMIAVAVSVRDVKFGGTKN